jgi:peptidoglycan/xylan/chitin deacetylase (PgdA/CDA1 family)
METAISPRMNLKGHLLRWISTIPWIYRYFSGVATIFMLHRVYPLEPHKLSPNENMKVSPTFLEHFILQMRALGYEFISLDQLHTLLVTGEKTTKKIVLTLDDGYKDNFTHAYPIIQKLNVPIAIYVTTAFPDKTARLWWYVLEDLILAHDHITLSSGERYPCATMDEKIDTFLALRSTILTFKSHQFSDKVDELLKNYTLNWEAQCEKLCMNWEEIATLANDPLVTIGGHTQNHFAFNALSSEEILEEIQHANEAIQARTGKKITHFAYPFGSREEVSADKFALVKTLGFKTVTTTRKGNIFPQHAHHLECLPRVMLMEDFDLASLGIPKRHWMVTQ